eukprot:m.106906 g.106906  ORF g.106906 m.106906 type:complete len:835 (-) comp14239_c0_seq3:124-2628(-)
MESGSSTLLTGSFGGGSLSLDARGRADTLPAHLSQQNAVERRSTSLTELLRSSLGRKKKLKIFGTSLIELPRHEHTELPSVVVAMVAFLSQNGLTFEGLFRVSGSQAAVTALRTKIDKEGQAVIPPDTSPAVVSSLLKLFLRELPEPVILPETLAELVAVSQEGSPEGLFDRYRTTLLTLPSENFALLSYLMELAARVVANKDSTKMTPQSMATVLSPNLFKMESQDEILAAHGATNTLIATFITHYRSIFKPAVRIPTSHAGVVFDTDRSFARASSFDETEETEYEIEQLANPARISEARVDSQPATPGLHSGALLSPHPTRRSPRPAPDDADRMLLAGGSTPSPTPDRSSPSSAARRTVPQLAATIHDFLFGDLPAIDDHPLLGHASGRASAVSNEDTPTSAAAPTALTASTATHPAASSASTTPAAPGATASSTSASNEALDRSLRDGGEGGSGAGLDGIAEEMRVLRHKIHDFDAAFEQQHGRPPGHGDRQPIARDVLRYKQLRRDRNAARDSVNASVMSTGSLADRSTLDHGIHTSEQPTDVITLLADRAKARMAEWYTRHHYSPQETNDLSQMQLEKTELKKILSLFDREFIAEKGKEPTREDKAPLLALYQRYKRVKGALSGDTEPPADPNASSVSVAAPAAATALAPLPAIPVAASSVPSRSMSAPVSLPLPSSAPLASAHVPVHPPAAAAAATAAPAAPVAGATRGRLSSASAQPGELRRTLSASELPTEGDDVVDGREDGGGTRAAALDIQDSIRYAALKSEKHQLQKRLAAFEAKFKEENGRRVESTADRMPFVAEYTRYKALKREIAVLEVTSSQFSPNVTL